MRRVLVDRVLRRYTALQVPGWLLAVLLLVLARQYLTISWTAIAGILALLVLKDIVIYPFVRDAYADDGRHGTERMIGSHGVATGRLAPSGYVRIGGELWRAETRDGEGVIPQGGRVRVADAHGLTLVVTAPGPRAEAEPPSSCRPTAAAGPRC